MDQQKPRSEELRQRFNETASLSSEEIRERVRRGDTGRLLWMALHTALMREGKVETALAELGRLVERGGGGWQAALMCRANLLWRLGRHQDAIADIQRLIALGDDQPSHFYSLGRLYYRLGEVEAARANWRRAIQRSRHPDQHRYVPRWTHRLVFATILNVGHYARCSLLWSYLKPPPRRTAA